ncbi:hypothetical protein [Micromonospora sp. NBC_01796]|uniref:hypothetical protein n=1 Tax=Micromonospora sp. NBC_01796 TaxID=2975987 RepID=UPI002DDA16C4|nr:hypothetical protein [Micromonospora sp. NBC_01796]WSA83171.1 hypothetical protein OIE47_22450 [Micromonospora sp. NBC_01796]
MAHGEAEHGCARGDQPLFRGDQDEQSTSFTGKPMRWVCGAVPAGAEVAPGSGATGVGASGVGPALTGPAPVGGPPMAEPLVDDGVVEVAVGSLVPRQRIGDPAGTSVTTSPATGDTEPVDPVDQVGDELQRAPSCQPDLPGWAGGHRHGAVRPRVRGDRRQRPPDRWC